jgi:hypothetical protein
VDKQDSNVVFERKCLDSIPDRHIYNKIGCHRYKSGGKKICICVGDHCNKSSGGKSINIFMYISSIITTTFCNYLNGHNIEN